MVSSKRSPRASRFRWLELTFCGAFIGFSWLVGCDIARGIHQHPAVSALIPVVALASVLAADFSSGFVHWLADTYATRTTPFVGPKFVAPFREHHEDPLAMTRHDFIEANADNCFLSLFVLVPAHLFLPGPTEEWGTVVRLFVLLLAIFVLLTNIIHAWAHRAHVPRFVAWLQRTGIVLSREHHAMHHQAPHDSHYCITTGWLNQPLDRMGFFRKLEWSFMKLGIRPGSDRGEPTTSPPGSEPAESPTSPRMGGS